MECRNTTLVTPQWPIFLEGGGGCHLWDAKTGEKMDKDRFRRDLGEVIEHYREVGRRIGAPL